MRRLPGIALALAGLALGVSGWSCRAGSPPARAPSTPAQELWYAISDGSVRYGWRRTTTRRLDGGACEYRAETLAQVEFLGAPQDHGATVEARVDGDLRPLRLEATVRQMSGTATLRGAASDEGFVVETIRAGEPQRAVRAVTGRLVLDLALVDWLHRRRARWPLDAEPERLELLASESGTTTEIAVRRLAAGEGGSRWEVSSAGEAGPAILEIDATGVLASQRTRTPPVVIERSTEAEARAIQRRRMPERELLVFTPAGDLPPLHRLAAVTVRLGWSGIPSAEFSLEDARQELVSLDVEHDRHVAVVELRRPGEPSGLATIPVTDERFASALAESDLLRPRDGRIVAQAREIVGDETSALAAVRALCAWVNGAIAPAMIGETLSGPEVLERRTGKCTEYATLFASLARAAGIPTRIALGQRRFLGEGGDSWGGHMWNEAWVGEWIPVDASANEVGGSPALLKFVHSDTVAGTQRLRWLLTESLSLEILGHETLPRAGGTAVTGVEGTTYTHAEEGFRIELPEDGWRIEPVAGGGATTLRIHAPGPVGSGPQVHLVAFPIDGGVPPGAIVAARLSAHRAALEAFAPLLDEPTRVGGLEGHRIRFEGRVRAKDGEPVRVTELVWTGAHRGLLLNLIATPEEHDANAPRLEAIARSFEFLE